MPDIIRPDLLRRISLAGLTGQKVELAAGLPTGSISRARYGRCTQDAPWLAVLEGWLDQHYPGTRGQGGAVPPPPDFLTAAPGLAPKRRGRPPNASRQPVPAAPPTPSSPAADAPAALPDPRAGASIDDLIRAIRSADTLEKSDALLSMVAELEVRGLLEKGQSKILVDLFKERRQQLCAIAEERARTDASKPLTVIVRYVDDWQKRRPGQRVRND